MNESIVTNEHGLDRAEGCLLGQVSGDALGSMVEFRSAADIAAAYPGGVRVMLDNVGPWRGLAGQPTDDSEMALMLARTLAREGTFGEVPVREAYRYWKSTDPVDIGRTTLFGLAGTYCYQSQANGALMRVSPLGVFAWKAPLEVLAGWALADCRITHRNMVCEFINVLYTLAIASAIREPVTPGQLYRRIVGWAQELAQATSCAQPTPLQLVIRRLQAVADPREGDAAQVGALVLEVTERASEENAADFQHKMGWVCLAWQNALWQLGHAESVGEALVATVGLGGDTDTNAAICGSLLGAVFGRNSIPEDWQQAVLNCRPQAGRPGVNHPRPECFWPVDLLALARTLWESGATATFA